MAEITDQTFTDTEVHLDNQKYSRCVFIRCVLHYSGGPFHLENCDLQAPLVSFHGAALWTVHFLKTLGWSLPGGFEIHPPEN